MTREEFEYAGRPERISGLAFKSLVSGERSEHQP